MTEYTIETPNENIREIEDIINIQKANGNFNVRQVAFHLPEEAGPVVSAGAARSFESGLTRDSRLRRRSKHRRGKWRKSKLDPVPWPSDSDITVLRMQTLARGADAAKSAEGGGAAELAGDGLHRPDGSSMVNLATLVLPLESASKHSLAQELLLPLSSWDQSALHPPEQPPSLPPLEFSMKARLARFLRLYFCPCCTCLYEMEKNYRDDPSIYLNSKHRSAASTTNS